MPPRASSATCPATLASSLASTGQAAQLVTAVAPTAASTTGSLELWQRSGGCFRPVAGPWPVSFGYAGVSGHRREGDGTTPTGAFGVGPVIYGVAPDPGVHYRYHRLVCGDWWDEDPSSPTYNTFQHVPCGTPPPFGGSSEALWEATRAYAHFVFVEYNVDPVVPGAGSAIFIHVALGSPTTGCVSLAAAHLLELVRWLRPAGRPLVVIGTAAGIDRY